MLIVKQDDSRKEEDGQIFVELTKNRGLDVVNCDRLGYWCDKAHLSHFIIECASCFTENELKDILKMNKETIEIKKDNVLAVYNTARNTNDYGTLHALESLFGIDFFKPKDIRERIKTFDDALKELGDDNQVVKEYYERWQLVGDKDVSKDYVAYLKLRIIIAALNEGWKPEFIPGEYRWAPYFLLYTKEEYEKLDDEVKASVVYRSSSNASAGGGVSCAGAGGGSAGVGASVGSRLAFKTEELAEYAGKQFLDIYADFLLPNQTEE